jgi:hypothetical protein
MRKSSRLTGCRNTATASVLGWVYSVKPDPRLLRHRGSGASAMAKTKRPTVTSGPRRPVSIPQGGRVMLDMAGCAAWPGITWPCMAGYGWTTVAVGIQLSYPAIPSAAWPGKGGGLRNSSGSTRLLSRQKASADRPDNGPLSGPQTVVSCVPEKSAMSRQLPMALSLLGKGVVVSPTIRCVTR